VSGTLDDRANTCRYRRESTIDCFAYGVISVEHIACTSIASRLTAVHHDMEPRGQLMCINRSLSVRIPSPRADEILYVVKGSNSLCEESRIERDMYLFADIYVNVLVGYSKFT